VAERSGDTAFRTASNRQKRRGASLPRPMHPRCAPFGRTITISRPSDGNFSSNGSNKTMTFETESVRARTGKWTGFGPVFPPPALGWESRSRDSGLVSRVGRPRLGGIVRCAVSAACSGATIWQARTQPQPSKFNIRLHLVAFGRIWLPRLEPLTCHPKLDREKMAHFGQETVKFSNFSQIVDPRPFASLQLGAFALTPDLTAEKMPLHGQETVKFSCSPTSYPCSSVVKSILGVLRVLAVQFKI